MVAETLRRDLRVGFRVLVKEKSFCALAVVVLALGICGVTTMFSVVNGVMLRGFDFPNADRLVSANFIDPSSANFFGVNGQISSMDFTELVPAERSLAKMAAYLNGSTVNVTVNNQPQRYTAAPPGCRARERRSERHLRDDGAALHTGSAAERIVVDGLVPVVREVTQLHQPVARLPRRRRPPRDAGLEIRRQRFRKQRHHVDGEHRTSRATPGVPSPPGAAFRDRPASRTRRETAA